MVEGGNILLEVLCDDLLRNMAEPVGHLMVRDSSHADRKYNWIGSTWNEEAVLKLPSGNTWNQWNYEVRTA